MNMVTEDYVSYDTAKLLKEKGFDVPVLQHYTRVKSLWRCQDAENFNEEKEVECYSAPTQQMVMRWLREVHNLFIQVELYQYTFEGEMKFQLEFFRYGSRLMKKPSMIFSSYEEAVEAAIKYTLENLI